MKRRAAFFTTSWDDGHPLDLRVAELLAKYGLRGTFYVPLESMFHRMSDDGIRQLGSSFEVGSHTVHHPDLAKLSENNARQEISESKERLEAIAGTPCRMFCFPRGRYLRTQLHLLREAGYVGARTGEWLATRFPRPTDDVMLMPTTINVGNHSHSQCWINLVKYKSVKNLPVYFRLCRGTNWVASFQRMMAAVVRQGGVFHVWGHSWELEEFQLWPELEEMFRLMAAHAGSVRFSTNGEVCDYTGTPIPENVGGRAYLKVGHVGSTGDDT